MSPKNVATLRTTLPTAWTTVLVWLVARFGFDPSADDWAVLALVMPVLAGIGYRSAREVEQRYPALGRVLFGSSQQPHYSTGDAA